MTEDEVELHVDVHGDGRKPFLLLVHGFLSSRAQWRPNLSALAEITTPVTVELLGHGRSPSPSQAQAYSVAAYVAAFDTLRRRLGADRWFVCGQSFGAGLTIRYALKHPDRVIGQVLTNSISGLSAGAADDDGERDRRAAALAAGGHGALKSMPFYPRASKRLPPILWEDLVADAELASPVGVAQTMRITASEISVAAELHRISVPTLLVNGVRERAFQPLRDLARRQIPQVEVVDVEDGGHAVNIDSAEAFNTAVTRFVSRLAGASVLSGNRP